MCQCANDHKQRNEMSYNCIFKRPKQVNFQAKYKNMCTSVTMFFKN